MTTPATVQALRAAYIALDMALTGKPEGRCDHNWTLKFHEWSNYKPSKDVAPDFAERFLHDVYYLSDSGYSRVGLDPDTQELFLTSNSRKEVKACWDLLEVAPLRKAATEAAHQLLREEGLRET